MPLAGISLCTTARNGWYLFNTEPVNTERDKLINLNVSAEIPQTLIDNKGKVKIMLWEEETQKPITENISYDLNELVEDTTQTLPTYSWRRAACLKKASR